MKMSHLMTAAAFATLLGGAAYAQSTADQPPAAPAPDATAPADQAPATQMTPGQPDAMSTTTTAPATQYNYNSATQPASSSTLGDPTSMKAGDPNVVSNGPVPDTRENRAKYGRPMSNAGKRSTPAGN